MITYIWSFTTRSNTATPQQWLKQWQKVRVHPVQMLPSITRMRVDLPLTSIAPSMPSRLVHLITTVILPVR